MCVVLLVASAPAMRGETVAGLPATPGFVNDYAGILSPETVQEVTDRCRELNLKAHARIAVVTLHSIDPDKSGAAPSIEEFATALEDKWKVGEKGTDRGLLLIISLNPRKYRIEVGYGLEGILNDAKVGDIGRDMSPYLRTGDYDHAVTLGVQELAQDIAADAGVTLTESATENQPQHQYHYENQPQVQVNPIALFVVGGVVVLVIGILIATGHIGILFYLLFSLLGGGRGGGGGGFGGGGGGGGGDGGGLGGGSGGGGASGDF